MLNYKKAIQRYRVAENFGLPFKLRIKVFFRGKGTPKENFEKEIIKKERSRNDRTRSFRLFNKYEY